MLVMEDPRAPRGHPVRCGHATLSQKPQGGRGEMGEMMEARGGSAPVPVAPP